MSPSIATSRMSFILPEPRKTSAGRLNLSAPGHELPIVSRIRITRRAVVLTATAAALVLGTAVPALADATITPTSAVQGSGENLTFHVTNTLQSPITKVKFSLPKDAAIAEVYPLSVDDWAPEITSQKLLTPLTTIHGGTPVSEATASITWIAMPGKSLAPGKSTDLSVAVGPLPTLSRMDFTIEATYANGSVVAMPPVTLTLREATAEDAAALAAEHAGHDAGTATDGTDTSSADDSAFAAVVAQGDQGPGFWSIAGWVFAALAGAVALVMVVRGRRRVGPASSSPEEEPAAAAEVDGKGVDAKEDTGKEKVGAGAGKIRASSWRYQDGDK
jgi:uncharacterized protein YcnI